MTNGSSVLIIDIGTHKGDEAILFSSRDSFSGYFRFIYQWLKYNRISVSSLKDILQVLKIRDSISRKTSCKFALVEPIPHILLKKRLAHINLALYFCGVVSNQTDSFIPLHLSADSLGHSIFRSKPNLTDESVNINNISIDAFFSLLKPHLSSFKYVLLRVNAEGLERDLIVWLSKHPDFQVDLMMGSLGDIYKCFGKDEYDRSIDILRKTGIEFLYFTSNASTWLPALKKIYSTIC